MDELNTKHLSGLAAPWPDSIWPWEPPSHSTECTAPTCEPTAELEEWRCSSLDWGSVDDTELCKQWASVACARPGSLGSMIQPEKCNPVCTGCQIVWQAVKELGLESGWWDKLSLILVSPTPFARALCLNIYERGLGGLPTSVVLRANADEPNPWNLAGCLPSTTSTDSPATMSLLRRWLDECIEDHPRCAQGVGCEANLPTRVLDVGTNASSPIALRETEGETGRYLCLSYCWGTAEFLKTTRDNLERHKQGIKTRVLPQTLQDAIYIARVLGVRYVWVDALCIIQDDEDNADWKRESGRMVDVYRNSYLTVAAAWADSAHGGCFRASEHDDIDLGSVTMRRIHHFPRTATPELSIHFPLLSRAWAYQERMLSPRVVHFGRQEILWECRQQPGTCECGTMTNGNDEVQKRTFHETISEFRSEDDSSPQHTWRQMVVQYSPLQLTYATDKLPAFSGLANEMQRKSKQDYLAGLWRDTLVLDMCWYRNSYYSEITAQSPYVFRRAPSWSWASVNWPITYPRALYVNKCVGVRLEQHPEILDAQCSLAGPSLTGQVTGGYVELRCSIIPAHVHGRFISVGSQFSSCWIPDRRCGVEEEGGEYYFIPMATAPTYDSDKTLIGLLVEPISPAEFIRVGLIVGLRGEGNVRETLGAEKRKVRIV